jgi:hypothetical protein
MIVHDITMACGGKYGSAVVPSYDKQFLKSRGTMIILRSTKKMLVDYNRHPIPFALLTNFRFVNVV